MNESTTQSVAPQRVMTLQIIAAALMMGVVTFGAVATFISVAEKPGEPLIGYLALGFGVMSIVMSSVLPDVIAKAAIANSGTNSADLFPIFQTKTIVGLALLEGAAMFCLVAYLITVQWWTLAGAAFLLAMMAVRFPTRNGVENWLRDQNELREFNSSSESRS